MINGIRWVDSLIEIVGGECFIPELRERALVPDGILKPAVVTGRDPRIVIGCMCG